MYATFAKHKHYIKLCYNYTSIGKNKKLQLHITQIMTDTDQDPVELMLKKTGCIELHYKVQECISESGDWRSCQEKVKEFRACMKTYVDAQSRKYAHVK